MFKIIALVLIVISTAYSLWVQFLTLKSVKNPMPANVADIYDGETYKKWQAYHRDNNKLSFAFIILTFALQFLLILFDVYSKVANLCSDNVYVQLLAVIGLYLVTGEVLNTIFGYISTMKIEQKYGFNKSTLATFVSDRIKSIILTAGLSIGFLCLFAFLYTLLGDWSLLLVFCILIAFLFFVIFIYPLFSKLFNKFTPLEDGELKDKLCALLTKYDYKIKSIKIMDASRRTTKSNAYFSGFGKTKTIVLYDNLVNAMSADEICAVFAHEMGHGLHKDTLKSNLTNIITVALIVIFAWLTVKFPAIYADFNFNYGVNFGFAFILLGEAELSVIQLLMGLLTNAVSRKAEYRADAQAVEAGYGEHLISGLKKLSKEDFSDLAPSETLVKLTYSHPPLSERITAIENEIKKRN